MRLPSILQSSLNINSEISQLKLVLFFDPKLTFFKGHFNDAPILPGIAQADFVIEFAARFLEVDKTHITSIPQLKFSKVIEKLLEKSQILTNSELKRRVQDPYCLRCQPQVMGAILTTLWDVEKYLVQEANAVSDNPLLFPDLGLALSGGNFHAELTAFQADFLSIAGSEIGAISERRIAFLVDKHMSGLPDFLVESNGLNSGFMIAQVTAAALASENKTYAHPASIDSIPTSANQEDHVSMATFAGMKGLRIAENVLHILAIEMLAVCQALDFRKPLETSPPLGSIYSKVRQQVGFYQDDRLFGPDVLTISQLISQRDFYETLYRQFFK